MLKVVVFDSGQGGELFADRLEAELPILDVIRVIDWRNADKIQKSPKTARQIALKALTPYIGRADLIIFANYLVSSTSLKYFCRKYKNQKFTGLKLPLPDTFKNRPTVILATRALSRTLNYYNYLFRLKRKTSTLCLDAWTAMIDDGELRARDISREFEIFYEKYHYFPAEIILTCSHFNDIIPELRQTLGRNLKIHDGFEGAIKDVCKILKIRGGTGRRKH